MKHDSWDGACLETAPEGCAALSDEYSCLASKDGRREDPYHQGLKAGPRVALRSRKVCRIGLL